jgi:hypothetical protein
MLVPSQSQRQSIAQVCGPFSLHTNRIMNPVAAHKDELKKLLENFSGDTAVSGIGLVASLDAYITRLDTNCSDIRARVNPIRRQRRQTEN